MDEETLDLLFDCGLTQNKTQQSPNEDFMFRVIMNFCNKFGIDGNIIQKPLFDQLQTTYPEALYEDIRIINLQTALVQIFDQLFVKEFCITDITSASAKRACKVLKTLANFCLYYNTKQFEVEERKNDMYVKYKQLQDSIQKTQEHRELTAELQKKTGNILIENEKLLYQIEKLQSEISDVNKEKQEIEEKVNNAKVKYQTVTQKCGMLKAEHVNSCKSISNLESKVVNLPETYKGRLKMLENAKEEKIKQRDESLTSVAHKKKLLELKEQLKKFVTQKYDKLDKYWQILTKLKDTVESRDFCEQQLEQMEKNICEKKEEQKKENDKMHCSAVKIDDLKARYEQQLLAMRQEQDNLLKKKKSTEINLLKLNMKFSEIMDQKEKILSKIQKLETSISENIKDYQELYEEEVKEEIEIRKMIEDYSQECSESGISFIE